MPSTIIMSPKDQNVTGSALTVAYFSAIALICIYSEKLKKKRRHTLGSTGTIDGPEIISARGEALLTPAIPYIMDYLKCLQVSGSIYEFDDNSVYHSS